jgi:hypothetical protein
MQMTDMPIAMMWGMGVIWLLIPILLLLGIAVLDQASPFVTIDPKYQSPRQQGRSADHNSVSAYQSGAEQGRLLCGGTRVALVCRRR